MRRLRSFGILGAVIAAALAQQALPALWIVPLTGLVALGIGGWLYRERRRFLKTAWSGDGTVVEVVRGSGRRKRSFYPRVRFSTPTGEEVEFVGAVGTNPPAFQTGQLVKVLYDPFDPTRARISSFLQLWLPPILLGVVGTGFLVVGAILLIAESA